MNSNYTDIRDAIFGELYDLASKDKKVVLLSADNGASIFKKFETDLPGQFFNVGIAEQNAMSVAAGLGFTGHRVFVVGIGNFVTLRCFEQIKVDIAAMKMPVTVLASGTGYFYGDDGVTHHMINNLGVLRTIPGLTIYSPSSFDMAAHLIHQAYNLNAPGCIWFDRGPFLPTGSDSGSGEDFSDGVRVARSGDDLLIIASGIMVGEAVRIAEELQQSGVSAGVADVYRVKPLNEKIMLDLLGKAKRVATLEEHTMVGGLGAAVAEFMAQNDLLLPLKMFGIPDNFRYEIGNREYLRSLDQIDAPHVVEKIKSWLK